MWPVFRPVLRALGGLGITRQGLGRWVLGGVLGHYRGRGREVKRLGEVQLLDQRVPEFSLFLIGLSN